MDAVTLDGLLGELRPRVVGQHLGHVRAAGTQGLLFELARGGRLWCSAQRDTAGLYLLDRDTARALVEAAADEEPSAATRQAVLLARKHLEGARVDALERAAGTRTVVLRARGAILALRLGGPAPALTLAVEGAPVATTGDGPPVWPLPEPDREHEWDHVDPARVEAALDEARAAGTSPVRAILSVSPGLGPSLARAIASGTPCAEVVAALAAARPTLVAPRALEECDDAALAARESVLFLPFPPPAAAGAVIHPESWSAAASSFLRARRRGARFARRQAAALEEARRRIRRLQRLDAHLAADRASLPEPEALRRQAEALLAHAGPTAGHEGRVEVADPYDPERTLRIEIDSRLSLPVNANRMFDKARRIERAGVQVAQRRRQVGEDLGQARRDEAVAQQARQADDLAPAGAGRARQRDGAGAGPRRYLTSRGLVLLVGRGARENQQLTFGTAAPEDWWLHARDVPGAHVVLRDPEGRASAEDLREAAEVAAFFSEARTQPQADVHSTRRKHVRPAGGAGRVRVAQSDTVRVRPRDPEGRLRSR